MGKSEKILRDTTGHNAPWLDDDLRITEARAHPLWTLADSNEAEEQGFSPEEIPHTFDPGDILNLPGSDFQGIHLEADVHTERVQLEIREGLVALRHLAAYRDSLHHGRVLHGWVLAASLELSPFSTLDYRLTGWAHHLLYLLGERFPGRQIPDVTLDDGSVPVEIPFSYSDLVAVLNREAVFGAGASLWPDIDATPPRRVLFPPGTTLPPGWVGPRPEGL